MDEISEKYQVTKTILADESGQGSTTRLCIVIGYVTFSIIAFADCWLHRGITSNSIIICTIMLGGGSVNYGVNAYKAVKKPESTDGQ